MKNILLISILSLGLVSACTQEIQNNKPTDTVKEQSPSVGQVVSDSLDNLTNSNKDVEPVEEETTSTVPKEQVVEKEIVVEEVPKTIEDDNSITVLKACNDLVLTITKNQPKINKPFEIQSTYKKLPNNESKVTIGFEAMNVSGQRTKYLGACTFDSENNLSSFSADPIKE